MASNCDECMNYEYDEYYECFTCSAELDEDEMYSFINKNFRQCPYFRQGDEYTIVKKQM